MIEQTVWRNGTSSHIFWNVDTTIGDTFGMMLMSDRGWAICQMAIFTCVCLTIDVFGTGTNTINIICFVKQGFKDPVNVSLLGLAVSDLGCLIPLIWTNICMFPDLGSLDLPFDPVEFQYLTGCWPHITFTRISAWMTALITLERCLCVIAPLQVKNLVTPKRVFIIIMCVFTVLIASVVPVYVVNRMVMKFKAAVNKTVIGIVFTEDREIVEKISLAINNVFITFSAFFLIIICTIIMIIKLKSNTQWRSRSTATKQADRVASRNQKVSRMVVMISTLFIACFVPTVNIFAAMAIDPEISINGRHQNLATILVGICFVLESINSSMNIFIYYHMSSKYRATFRRLFVTEQRK